MNIQFAPIIQLAFNQISKIEMFIAVLNIIPENETVVLSQKEKNPLIIPGRGSAYLKMVHFRRLLSS